MYFKGKTIQQIKMNIRFKDEKLMEVLKKNYLYDDMYTDSELLELICFSIKAADINDKFEYGKCFLLKGVVPKNSQYIYLSASKNSNCIAFIDYIGTSIKIPKELLAIKNKAPDSRIHEIVGIDDFWDMVEKVRTGSLSEPWEFKDHTEKKFKKRNYVLERYIEHTFSRLIDEGKVYFPKDENNKFDENNMFFNLGLYNEEYDEICIHFSNKESDGKYKKCDVITKDQAKKICNIDVERACYFDDINDIIFDNRIDVDHNFKHILDDEKNIERLPEGIKRLPKIDQRYHLESAIKKALKELVIDYRLAVPQYYKGNVQLLVPVYFEDADFPLVLTLGKVYDKEKHTYHYQGFTCLTYEMAYNNARQIARQTGTWLKI